MLKLENYILNVMGTKSLKPVNYLFDTYINDKYYFIYIFTIYFCTTLVV